MEHQRAIAGLTFYRGTMRPSEQLDDLRAAQDRQLATIRSYLALLYGGDQPSASADQFGQVTELQIRLVAERILEPYAEALAAIEFAFAVEAVRYRVAGMLEPLNRYDQALCGDLMNVVASLGVEIPALDEPENRQLVWALRDGGALIHFADLVRAVRRIA